MVVLTVFTVGYDEVLPVDNAYLRVVTIALIVLGCGGMIVASSALVQFLTSLQIQQLLGQRRMTAEIDGCRAASSSAASAGSGRCCSRARMLEAFGV